MDTYNTTPKTELDLEPFFSLSHDFLCIAGFDGYFRKINPAFINLMGYTEEELFSHPIRQMELTASSSEKF
ncbi:PAS domain-containing protein [Salegentibacter sp. F14]